VHSGPHYLEPPEHAAEPIAPADDSDDESQNLEAALDHAVDVYIGDDDIGIITDPALVERNDDADYVANLPDHVAPLTELVGLPLAQGNKVRCPFHDELEPSCAIYPDHFHCYGCGEHGDRLDWLVRVEGMTKAEAISWIKDWPPAPAVTIAGTNDENRLMLAKSIWTSSLPITGTIAEQYLDVTRHIDITRLPDDLHRCLRFNPHCLFGPGHELPCLVALMRHPVTDQPVGIQRTALEVKDGQVRKIERRMLGRAGVVKIWPAATTLVVGEGLETVLAAATRIPYRGHALVPAWAALSRKNLAELPIIGGVERLVLLIDNDSNQEGQRAAAAVTELYRSRGRVVVPLMPPRPDTDFNDLVAKEDDSHVSV
jgi:hypothetical protein